VTAAQAFRIHAADNVATLLSDVMQDDILVVQGDGEPLELKALQTVRAGHKIALRELSAGDRVIKYGAPIGEASQRIVPGEWVHLHNCRSLYEALSSELDIESGARNETRYV
jgi:altronate dehydratase small subunit